MTRVQQPTLPQGSVFKVARTPKATQIAKYLHIRTDSAEQFQAAYMKVTTSAELVTLGVDERGRTRFTTREMIDLERGMFERAERLAAPWLVSCAR